MGDLKSFWGSATTRAIAVVSVIGLFVVYLVRSWRKAGVDRSLQHERVKTLETFANKRVELEGKSVEEINHFESDLQFKLSAIDAKAHAIKAEVDGSRKRLANALNKSFGR